MKEILNKINIFNCKTLPRKIFTFYFIAIAIGTILLLLPISRSNSINNISLIDAIFTASSAFSDTGLIVLNTGKDFSIFGQVVIMLLIQIGGIGLMALKILLLMFIGKKIGLKEKLIATNERGSGKIGNTYEVIKTSLIVIFITELVATILFSLRYYFKYFDTPVFDGNVFNVIFQALFAAISSTNNAGFDILGGNSLEMFANDYYIQIVTMICFIIGGLGFPLFYDIKNLIKAKIKKEKYNISFFTKFVLRVYFGIALISLILVFIIELTSGTLLYDKNIPLIQRIFYVIFNTFSTRNAGYATTNISNFAPGTQVVYSILMWIGAAPSSTGGGIRITTFFICLLALYSFSKNRNNTVFLNKAIPENTVKKSLLVSFLSQSLLIIVAIIIISSSNNISLLEGYFEASSAFGTTGLTLGITTSLSTISKIAIIFLMFIGQLGVSSTILVWSNKKNNDSTLTYPQEDIIIN